MVKVTVNVDVYSLRYGQRYFATVIVTVFTVTVISRDRKSLRYGLR